MGTHLRVRTHRELSDEYLHDRINKDEMDSKIFASLCFGRVNIGKDDFSLANMQVSQWLDTGTSYLWCTVQSIQRV